MIQETEAIATRGLKLEAIEKNNNGMELFFWGESIKGIAKEDLKDHGLLEAVEYVECELYDLIGSASWNHSIFKHAQYGLVYELYIFGYGTFYYSFNNLCWGDCDCEIWFDCDCDDCDTFCDCDDCPCACHLPYDCGNSFYHAKLGELLNEHDIWDAIKDKIFTLSEIEQQELKNLDPIMVHGSCYYMVYEEITREVM